MKWKEDIVKLNSPHSKLLYMIYYYSKSEQLTLDQATKLKEYVVLEDGKIFEILNEFEGHGDEIKLLNDMKQIYNEEVKFNEFHTPKSIRNDSINNVGYKKQLSVNTDRSFLNNAMSNIKSRMTVGENSTPQIDVINFNIRSGLQ